jgi:Cytochrome c3
VFVVRPRALVPLTASLFAAAFFCAHLTARSSSSSTETSVSLATEDRVESPGWWPTKSAASLSKFVGTAECAKCHTQIAASQSTTPMARAATPAANSEILQSHADLTEQRAAYHYELSTSQNAVNFSVTDGAQSLSASIAWAFGLGHKGQTYIYERDGGFYESHLSFYKSLQALDLTTGHDAANPDDLKSAMGRWLDADETRRCFGCHTTASSIAGHFDTSHLTPGVQCESCHGPGANHVAAMKSGKIEQGRAAIFNPHLLNSAASVDFCGACHRTWADVILADQKLGSVMNVRFQPYRLEDSKCWRNSNGDPRLACTTCHNPHEQLNQDASSYDTKCLTCHSPVTHAPNAHAIAATTPHRAENSPTNFRESRAATPVGQSHENSTPKICPQSKSNCITCHMPQVEVPTVHATFFDHHIRIVRPNSPYPM